MKKIKVEIKNFAAVQDSGYIKNDLYATLYTKDINSLDIIALDEIEGKEDYLMSNEYESTDITCKRIIDKGLGYADNKDAYFYNKIKDDLKNILFATDLYEENKDNFNDLVENISLLLDYGNIETPISINDITTLLNNVKDLNFALYNVNEPVEVIYDVEYNPDIDTYF